MSQPIPTPNLFWKTKTVAPFKPSDLGSVLAEFDASNPSDFVLSGNAVTSWQSVDGGTVLASSGADDNVLVDDFFPGNNAAVFFDGNSGLVAPVTWAPPALTWFIVAHAESSQSGGANRFISFSHPPDFDYANNFTSTSICDTTGDDWGTYYNGAQQFDLPTANNNFVGACRITAAGAITGYEQDLGGTLQTATSSAVAPAFDITDFFIGTNSEPMPLFGQVGYIIIYYRALTDAEVTKVLNYLQSRFS